MRHQVLVPLKSAVSADCDRLGIDAQQLGYGGGCKGGGWSVTLQRYQVRIVGKGIALDRKLL